MTDGVSAHTCEGGRVASQREVRPGALILGSNFNALSVVRSLGRRGIPCAVADHMHRAAWYSRYVRHRIALPAEAADAECIARLLAAAEYHGLDGWVLFPAGDEAVEMVARSTATLADTFRLTTQPWEIVRWGQDKRLLYRLAEEAGIPCPRTWSPSGEAELGALDLPFPVVVKPITSTRLQHAAHQKVLLAHDAAELRAHYRLAATIHRPDELLVQEAIPGGGDAQFSVGAYCEDGDTRLALSVRRTRQYPRDYGTGTFVEAVARPDLVAYAAALFRRLRLSGLVEVEFKFDPRDGQYKVLDVNVRAWGWQALGTACGVDFAWAQYRAALGEPVEAAEPEYRWRWLRLLGDLPAGWQEIRSGHLTPVAYVRSLVGPTAPAIFAGRDPLPAFGELLSAVRRAASARR